MAGGKETTRQKMINIMYLVLMAMLAINVSDSVLNAFKNLNDSLSTSRRNVQTGVDGLFQTFEQTKLKEEPVRAKPIYDKAKLAAQYATELKDYIKATKKELVEVQGGGFDPQTGDLVNRSDMDLSARFFINENKAVDLQKKINDTKAKLLSLLDDKDKASIKFSLDADDPEGSSIGKKSWGEANFGDGTPLTAAFTVLTNLESEVTNDEATVVRKVLGKMDQALVNLDQFAAVAVAPSSYVIQGQPYKAEVFLTAYDSKSNPVITVNGSSMPVKDGKATYTGGTGSVGVFKWVGTVRVKQTDGQIKEYKTPEQTYQVAKPSSSVTPTNMNVIYAGIPNPFSVSAAGFPLESVNASISGGSMSKSSAGNYMVNVPGSMVGKTVTINVSSNSGGKSMNLGSQTFRVKKVPNPVARFAGVSAGKMNGVQVKNENSIFAVMDNFDFEGLRFNITKFSFAVARPGRALSVFTGAGNSLTPAMKAELGNLPASSRVMFSEITASGPDGSSRTLNPIVITIN